MHPLRNIVFLISLSGAAQAALVGARSTENSGIEVAQPDSSEAQPPQLVQRENDDEEDDDAEAGFAGNDGTAVLAELDSRAVKCYTRSRPKKNCYQSQCPGNKQCKVNASGNCVFRYTQSKRPFGCSQCLCYKASG
ncbi:hypothetical protein FPOAC2_10024 [Fusarium poae]|uniref:Uncharacterized protein n=1 Tax=Fusarium poae TaxID=36050 RepID=A0A1B8AR61_FUSPO|nr:hypothetical protein FPOAC1_010079 [Fusarium poae]KAG8670646.1 hypothetical protein FPOAC1_010079 [Fusarium poae]OBS22844.1 hypothetical protein FPOA_09167 [Fusarium poae]